MRPAPRNPRETAGGMTALLTVLFTVGACTPTVKLQAPDEPIRFDVNVNVTEEKRIQIDQALLELIKQNPSLFGFEPGEVQGADISGSNGS